MPREEKLENRRWYEKVCAPDAVAQFLNLYRLRPEEVLVFPKDHNYILVLYYREQELE